VTIAARLKLLREVGIKRVIAEVRPDQKHLRQSQAEGRIRRSMVLMMPQHWLKRMWESQLVRERMWRSLLVTSRSFLVSYKDRDRNSTRELPFVTSNKISLLLFTTWLEPIAAGILFPSWLSALSLRVQQWHLVPFQSSQMPCVCVTSILKRSAARL